MMRREWRALGHAEPTHSNDRASKAFELFLPDLTRAAMKATPEVTPEVAKLILILEGAMGRGELMAELGLKDEKHFREQYQQTVMSLELIEMTIPDRPRSSKQRYRLTESGSRWKAKLMSMAKEKGME